MGLLKNMNTIFWFVIYCIEHHSDDLVSSIYSLSLVKPVCVFFHQ